MKVFLHIIVGNDGSGTNPLSLGIVTDQGHEFYAAFIDGASHKRCRDQQLEIGLLPKDPQAYRPKIETGVALSKLIGIKPTYYINDPTNLMWASFVGIMGGIVCVPNGNEVINLHYANIFNRTILIPDFNFPPHALSLAKHTRDIYSLVSGKVII